MAATHEDTEAIAQLFYTAVQHVMHGNSVPMLALWSEHDDVTYIDPQGFHHKGHAGLISYWQRAAHLNGQEPGSISTTADLIMAHSSDSMISTVMAENIQLQQPDNVRHMVAVATNIYRREGQQWRMIHRHSGYPAEEKQ